MGKGAKNRAKKNAGKNYGRTARGEGTSPPPDLPEFFRPCSPVPAIPHYRDAWDRLLCVKIIIN